MLLGSGPEAAELANGAGRAVERDRRRLVLARIVGAVATPVPCIGAALDVAFDAPERLGAELAVAVDVM